MKTPSIKQLAAATATAAPAPVAPHVAAAHQAVESVETVRLNFDVPKELHTAVKTKAAASGTTMKGVLLEFLREYTSK
jgi:hypothetical protein